MNICKLFHFAIMQFKMIDKINSKIFRASEIVVVKVLKKVNAKVSSCAAGCGPVF